VEIGDSLSENDLARVVDAFYDRVRSDAELGPIFNKAIGDWETHLRKLTDFWSSVMLTSGRYKGQPMAAHFQHASNMTPAAFSRWLALWRETTSALLPPDEAAAMLAKAERIAESLSLGIAFQQTVGASPTTRLASVKHAASAQ